MTNDELDKKLAGARSPKLEPEYLEDFPRAVFAKARSTPVKKIAVKNFWWPRLAWSGGLAFASLLIVLAIGHWPGKTETPANDVLANVKTINETLALFPNRVRAIVQDEHGLNLVLSGSENVPDSPPLFVKICDGKNCSSLVTFSGQEIEIAGQKITVLADANGGIILEGKKFVWSSAEKNLARTNLKIEAKTLGPATM
jgi:hypothetical protein